MRRLETPSPPAWRSRRPRSLRRYNTSLYQWAYYVTTASNASGSASLTVSFADSLPTGGITIVDQVQIAGNDTSNPIVTSNEKVTNLSSGTATANLPSAPGTQDATLAFLSGAGDFGASAPLGSPAMTNAFYNHQGAGTMDIVYALAGAQNESFTFPSQFWGTIALEIKHG
jgi:hypothetical protein